MADRRSPAGVFADIVSRITALERRISPLPTRLGARGMEVTDLDEALEYGTYWARVSAANNPVGNIALVEVFPYGPEDPGYHRIMQEARFPTITSSNQIKTWRRVLDVANGTWTPWVEVSQAIIDAVPNPAWGDVTGKPSSFPSTWSDVSGKPSTFPSTWGDVSGKPSTFPPSAHTQPWGDVTSKPSTFTPSAHTHAASDIASGTFAAARLPASTESAIGGIEIATQAEVNAGTDNTRAVTPSKLRNSANIPWAMAAGITTTPSSGYQTVTFPSGRFSQPPVVTATNGAPSVVTISRVVNVTTTSFQVGTWTVAGTQINGRDVMWTAVQMSSGSGPG